MRKQVEARAYLLDQKRKIAEIVLLSLVSFFTPFLLGIPKFWLVLLLISLLLEMLST